MYNDPQINQHPLVPKVFTAKDAGYRAMKTDRRMIRLLHGCYIEIPTHSLKSWEWDEVIFRARISALKERLHTDFVLSHRSAALLHGLMPPTGGAPQIIQPFNPNSRDSQVELIRHRLDLDDSEVVEMAGFKVTSLKRTLADLLCTETTDVALPMIDRGLALLAKVDKFHPENLPAQESLRAELHRDVAGRRNCRRARVILRIADGRSESPGESRLRLLALRLGMPQPELQSAHFIRGKQYFTDLEWVFSGTKIAAEYDGFGKYADHSERILAEKSRDIDLHSAGVITVHFMNKHLHPRSLPAIQLLDLMEAAGVARRNPPKWLQPGGGLRA